MTDDERLARWHEWDQVIRRDLIDVFHHRDLWQTTTKAIQRVAPDSPGTWIRHYATLYAQGQMVAIRRVVRGRNSGSVSLFRLLREIADHPAVISVDRHLQTATGADEDFRGVLRARYQDTWGDSAGVAVDPKKVRQAINALGQRLTVVFTRVDKQIAHIEEEEREEVATKRTTFTFDELDQALRAVGEEYQHWADLLNCVHYELTPVVQTDWQATFAKPLFSERDYN
jgi:hypothetical protein